MEVVQQILVDTEDQVPADVTCPMIDEPQQLISPIPTLQVLPELNPFLALVYMPTDFMEQEVAAAQKQAGVEEAEMPDASPAEAEAEADIEVEADEEADDELEEEKSEDLITHYFHVTESQSHYDENWLTVLWLYQDHEQPLRYRLEALKYWEKANEHAQVVNGELLARGKKPVPASWMYSRLFEHMKAMGMDVLTQIEIDSGYTDPNHPIKDRISQCIKDLDVETKKVAKEKKEAYEKRYRMKRTEEKNDTTLRQKFCMGMLANRLPWTLIEMGFRVQLGDSRG